MVENTPITVYTAECISAVNTKRRDGFNRMIRDALAGKIDLIVTKSVTFRLISKYRARRTRKEEQGDNKKRS